MNKVMQVLLNRRSTRAFEPREIEPEVKAQLLQAAMRAPTAGNLMLYSIIEVGDQSAKDALAVSCDNQPFIAKAPLVLLFLADYQRWNDYFEYCGVPQSCTERGLPVRTPQEGDLFLACCDALIAAQNAVIAAESFGIGSCYIGDIMEQYETHRRLFNLPRYVFPICLLTFGYPTDQQKKRPLTTRFDQEYILFQNTYRRLEPTDFDNMFRTYQERMFNGRPDIDGHVNAGQVMYHRKFNAAFSVEMTRSVRLMLKEWSA